MAGGATPVIALKQNLTGINVGPLLKDAANFDTLDVSGQGNTMSAIKKAFHGNVAIKLTNGPWRSGISERVSESKAWPDAMVMVQVKR